jgi:hypothetical protein
VGGIRSGVKVQQLAENDARAGTGVLRQREGLVLGEEGVVLVVGDQEGGLFSGGDLGGLGGGRVLAVEQALVGALAQMPQDHTHGHRSGEQHDEEDGLIAGDHG